jgi:multicomponent Na+:H+ antiporter subunit D
MSQHYPALIVVIPLLAALFVAAAGWINKKYCFPVAVASLAASLLSSVFLLAKVMQVKEVVYEMAGWSPPIGIVYRVDFLNGLVIVVVMAVALINLIYAKSSIEHDFPDKQGTYYALYILFVTGLAGMVLTGDAFNLYVLMEIASLTGYALMGLRKDRATVSALNYLIVGTVGATFYLLGVGYIYMATGTLNMAEIASFMPQLSNSDTIRMAFVICLAGLFVKMAFFPLHGWLPNAYTYTPTASIGMIAPLTTKVTVYIMIRMGLTIFTPEFSFKTIEFSGAIVWLAIIGIVAGSCMALAQKNFKKMLTYIIIAEVGYMVGGFWLGNKTGISGSILHIANDALMTLCLFMAAGIFAYKVKGDNISDLQGLFKKMPFTMAAFVIGGLSIIGVPPTCGFFSKWYLISGGIEAGNYFFVGALLFSSLVNAVMFFRIFEVAYFEPFPDSHGHGHDHEAVTINEAPLGMLIPFYAVAISLVILGIYSGELVTKIIHFAIPAGII